MVTPQDTPETHHAAERTAFKPLLLLLLLGAVVRIVLVFVFHGQTPEIVDAQDYDGLAVRLIETGNYQSESGELISLRPPLYPYLVSVLYRAFGLQNYTAVRIAQSALSLVTMLLVYCLGKELYSSRVGLWAAGGYCFYPPLLGMNNLLLSEGLFTFFLTLAMLLAVRILRAPSFSVALTMGVSLALGALTRSILWLFSPLFSVLLFFAIKASFGRRALLSGAVLCSFLIVISPWAYRNTELHKTLVIVDVMGGRNVMMGNYEYTPLERSWATITDVTGEKAWHNVLAANTPGYHRLTQGQIDKAAMKYGIKFFFSHPGLSIKRSLVKFFNFWQLERTFVAGMMQGIFGDVPKNVILALAVILCGSYALMTFLAIYGILMVPPENRWAHWLLLFCIAFTCLIHTAAFAHSRYNMPLAPLLLVYAAACVSFRKEIWSRRRSWQFAMASLLCLMLVAGWVREFVMVDLHHFQ